MLATLRYPFLRTPEEPGRKSLLHRLPPQKCKYGTYKYEHGWTGVTSLRTFSRIISYHIIACHGISCHVNEAVVTSSFIQEYWCSRRMFFMQEYWCSRRMFFMQEYWWSRRMFFMQDPFLHYFVLFGSALHAAICHIHRSLSLTSLKKEWEIFHNRL